jgi:hypothetical protein
MTTRRFFVRRERAVDWPMFEGSNLPEGMEVLSIEASRLVHEEIDDVVQEASDLLRIALERSMWTHATGLWLLTIGSPISRKSRSAALKALKRGVRGDLERDGLFVSAEPDVETEINLTEEEFVLTGNVEINPADLAVAIRITRIKSAIVTITSKSASRFILDRVSSQLSDGAKRPDRLVPLAVPMIDSTTFLVRGFGEFDDVRAGVDVFAVKPLIDSLEQALEESKGWVQG